MGLFPIDFTCKITIFLIIHCNLEKNSQTDANPLPGCSVSISKYSIILTVTESWKTFPSSQDPTVNIIFGHREMPFWRSSSKFNCTHSSPNKKKISNLSTAYSIALQFLRSLYKNSIASLKFKSFISSPY